MHGDKMGASLSIPTESPDFTVFTALAVGSVVKLASVEYMRRKKRGQFVEVGEVAGIYLYPIKSTQGWSLTSAECTPLGVSCQGVTDRHLLLTESDGTFLTMRKVPRMALIQTTVKGDLLLFDAPEMETLKVPKKQSSIGKTLKNCRIWDDKVSVVDSGDEAGLWFSNFLNKPGLRLLFYAPEIPKREAYTQRKPWEHKAQLGDRAAFADFSAYMIASYDSLDVLNQNLDSSVTIRNFRPNIVVSGNGAFKEESWSEVRIGDATFRALDLCTRCLQTTVDPDTGVKDKTQEPLATLKKLNSNSDYKNQAVFGVNAALDSPGRIRVGDKVFAFMC